MPYYHVRLFYYVTHEPPKINHLDQINLQRAYVTKEIIEPYLLGKSFKFKGRVFRSSDIADFMIKRTLQKVLEIIIDHYENFVYGTNVTDTLLKRSKKEENKILKISALQENVFIVHGKDHKPMKELKAMLEEFKLNPIVLHEQPSGSRTIVEKLEKYSEVGYAFVVLTPDDLGGSSKDRRILRLEAKERARQNVILEFGYFIGKLGRDKVCCLLKGDVERPSDMHGIVYIPFKESVNEVRGKIVKELKAAGYKIKM